METMYQLIHRVWGNRWEKLPIDLKINLKSNYYKTLKNRARRYAFIINE